MKPWMLGALAATVLGFGVAVADEAATTTTTTTTTDATMPVAPEATKGMEKKADMHSKKAMKKAKKEAKKVEKKTEETTTTTTTTEAPAAEAPATK